MEAENKEAIEVEEAAIVKYNNDVAKITNIIDNLE